MSARSTSLAYCLIAAAALSAARPAAAADVSGSAALTTDYVFRGITQTQGDPAAQVGIKVAAPNGIYAAAWGSTVEFPGDTGASMEVDYVLGWSGAVGQDWALDANATYYDYPSSRADLAYAELIGTLTWRSDTWVQLGYSNDVFATGADGTYVQLGHRFPLTGQLRLEAAAGHYFLDDAYGEDYSHAQLGIVYAATTTGTKVPLEFRLTAHATDRAAKRLFPDLAGDRIEAAVQATF